MERRGRKIGGKGLRVDNEKDINFSMIFQDFCFFSCSRFESTIEKDFFPFFLHDKGRREEPRV